MVNLLRQATSSLDFVRLSLQSLVALSSMDLMPLTLETWQYTKETLVYAYEHRKQLFTNGMVQRQLKPKEITAEAITVLNYS